ncbi:class I SAM-dependent methyltransferase [soil metagenome]
MRRLFALCIPLIDLLLVPVAMSAALAMRVIRRGGVERLPKTLQVFRRIGIYPVRDHYYEPLFNPSHLRKPLSEDRVLPGLDWNVDEQLDMLKQFDFNDELLAIPLEPSGEREYFYNNDAFASGDAEFLYNVIRLKKPRRIFEIGSGSSTLLAARAVQSNRREDPGYTCEHVCIEPYEADWLETLGVTTVREPVERLDLSLFGRLEKNDILFIDSSHMIRPQGDVVVEYLEILPILHSGVLIHVHDIFSPKDYLDEWIRQNVCFWNEQYLLEAFLSFNSEFKIIGALNFLRHRHPAELGRCCPVLESQMASREPGSFWMRRV